MKKKILIIVLIFIILFFAVLISNIIASKRVKIEEYQINKSIEKDINNDTMEEKISINIDDYDLNDRSPIFKGWESEIEYDICINGKSFNFTAEKGEEIISFATGDVDMDGELEILVCVCDAMVSPSYRQWNVYEYENSNITFRKKIYDGKMKYNILTDKLTVTYSLHEAPEGMLKTVYYEFD